MREGSFCDGYEIKVYHARTEWVYPDKTCGNHIPQLVTTVLSLSNETHSTKAIYYAQGLGLHPVLSLFILSYRGPIGTLSKKSLSRQCSQVMVCNTTLTAHGLDHACDERSSRRSLATIVILYSGCRDERTCAVVSPMTPDPRMTTCRGLSSADMLSNSAVGAVRQGGTQGRECSVRFI